MSEKQVKLSVLSTEPRYNFNYEENTYTAGDQMVSYGKDNDAPMVFRDCYRNSATLGAIINTVVDYVCGEEVVFGGVFAEKVNRTGMTPRQFVASIALDYEVYGGYAFQVIYSKLGIPVELYPLDFAKCRTNVSGSKIYYSKKGWTKYQSKSEVFDRFDMSNIDKEKMTQIFYYKGDFTKNVYPLPPYFSALNDVLTEIECSKYSRNSVSNGFSAKYILNFPEANNLTDEQKNDIEKSIQSKFCGSETDSNFMMYWADGEQFMDIKKIESDDSHEKYIAIKDNARSNIYTAMRTNPLLCGLNQNSGFSTQEFSDSFRLFQKTVIGPIQRSITEGIEKVIGKGNATITKFNIDFE